jgi:hypothetical protein
MAGVRHVWVRPAFAPTEMPGLVLGWRQTPTWEAQVVYVDPRGRVAVEWLPADQLRPIQAQQRTGSAYG